MHRVCVLLVMVAAFAAVFAAGEVGAVPISIVGTNDLHGQVERVAALAGHVQIVRKKNEKNGGGTVLLDAGDMFQGTLESNLNEGQAVIVAYNHVGYDAVCIGNHEFDFGPAGPAVTVKPGTKDDPNGALKARAKEARFPFLAANIHVARTKRPIGWPNVRPSTVVEVGTHKVKVGVIGLTTVDTPKTTIKSNVFDLRFMPLKDTVVREAALLRQRGARVVVVVAHAGGRCDESKAHDDESACEVGSEITSLARALPEGTVDAIVAGHTHQTMAHIVAGIPIIESWANGRGFGRVDLDVDIADKTKPATVVKVHAPRRLCGDDKSKDSVAIEACAPSSYEGETPRIDKTLLQAVAPYVTAAKAQKQQKLGVVVAHEVARGYDKESALGNLFAELMLDSKKNADGTRADVAIMNGGGIRSNLPTGELTYGHVFEMMPFDNRFATVTMSGKELRTLFEQNLDGKKKGGVFSIAGLRARAACDTAGNARVTLTRADKSDVGDDEQLVVITTDFVATGGDGGLGVADKRVILDEGEPIREALALRFRERGGVVRGDDKALFDAATPRFGHGAGVRCVVGGP